MHEIYGRVEVPADPFLTPILIVLKHVHAYRSG
jgi:hypothetical protein